MGAQPAARWRRVASTCLGLEDQRRWRHVLAAARPTGHLTAGSARALANASFSKPRIETEVQQVFELNYQARTPRPGGQFGVDALRGLVGCAYADYTLPLLDREIRDAQAGVLQQVTFKDVVGCSRHYALRARTVLR